MTDARDSLSSVVFGMVVVVLASVSVVSIISSQNVTASSCSSLMRDADIDVAESEAGNATTMMMTNQTAGGKMTGTGTNSTS